MGHIGNTLPFLYIYDNIVRVYVSLMENNKE